MDVSEDVARTDGKHSLFLMCDCHSHMIELTWDPKEPEWGLMFAAWKYGRDSGKYSWKERIRWIWHFLRDGSPFTDETCLSPEKAAVLRDWLIERFPVGGPVVWTASAGRWDVTTFLPMSATGPVARRPAKKKSKCAKKTTSRRIAK